MAGPVHAEGVVAEISAWAWGAKRTPHGASDLPALGRNAPAPRKPPRSSAAAMNRVATSAAAIAAPTVLFYVVFLGGTGQGELQDWLRLLNSMLAGSLLIIYVMRAPVHADAVDRAVLAAVVLFTGAAVLSQYPRQSFDAALAALTYAAAFFVGRDLLAPTPARRLFVHAVMGMSAVVTVITAARWLPLVLEWSSLAGWIVPPLDLGLPASPWGHRHDLTLLSVMLYPSWWIGRPTRRKAAGAVVIGLLTLLLVVMDGSRALWLAMAASTAILFGPPVLGRLNQDRRARVALVGIATVAGGVLLLTEVGGAVADRLLNFNTLGARSAMWTSLTEAWFGQPLAGYGPGSFPWILQRTDYFDTSSWAPRHPDSVLFQLLPEAGLLGIAAAICLLVFVLPAVLRARSSAARWSICAFLVAGVGANPTDFAFLIAVAVAWAAYALPRLTPQVGDARPMRTTLRLGGLSALGIIGIAHFATVLAGFAHTAAREAVATGDTADAQQHLSIAIALDPGMALYWRERGGVLIHQGQAAAAVRDLEHATARNPSDALAWRTLALAHAKAGDMTNAFDSLAEAIKATRADPTNLLLAAQWALDAGRDEAAIDTLGEVIQAWPAVVAAPGWDTMMAAGRLSTDRMVEMAADRLENGTGVPEGNAVLLAILAERDGGWIANTGPGALLAQATIASYRCSSQVPRLLASADDSDRRTVTYWEVVLRASGWRASHDTRAQRLYELMTGGVLEPALATRMLDPLTDNNVIGFDADVWGYRRLPLTLPEWDETLPSPAAGAMRWRFDPSEAAEASAIEVTADCG